MEQIVVNMSIKNKQQMLGKIGRNVLTVLSECLP